MDVMALEIDIEKVIGGKKPELLRKIPGPVLRYVKRTIHQEDINDILKRYDGLTGTAFIDAVLDEWNVKRKVIQSPLIDPNGRYIFAANHPLGGLDGIVLASEIEHRFGSVKLIVNDVLMHIEPIRSLFLPINKFGRQNTEYARSLNRTYDSDEQIMLFPAGICSRKKKFIVQDAEWKKSFITKAIAHRRDVVPVFVNARNSNFFYNLSMIRKGLGIKHNIEMFYLPDEMFRQKGKTIELVFGEPISWKNFTADRTKQEWADYVRGQTYDLKKRLSQP